ncbi:hypothetical protein SCOCK_50251 [Actinacidiphila cocklensis]|uniref:Uncharacterized protein n=1 Tax=Actinacidiphila cocklensis TaxID=887465 RepID=A0A9W4E162_9ACTN|nr:hypothetical protein SCOCK_50251 [Actinacidiphila cocklensis]
MRPQRLRGRCNGPARIPLPTLDPLSEQNYPPVHWPSPDSAPRGTVHGRHGSSALPEHMETSAGNSVVEPASGLLTRVVLHPSSETEGTTRHA